MRRNKALEKHVSRERIGILFGLAEKEALKGNLERANHYVDLALTIGMRYNISSISIQRRSHCRGCHTFLLPGITARVRIGKARIVYTCLLCGRVSRYPFFKEKRRNLRDRKPPANK